MPNDIEFLKSENIRLHGQLLAVETILFEFVVALRHVGTVSQGLIDDTFDNAIDALTAVSLKLGKAAHPDHVNGAIKIVETVREQIAKAE